MTLRYMERTRDDLNQLINFVQTDMKLFVDSKEEAAKFAVQVLIYDKLSQLANDRGKNDDR